MIATRMKPFTVTLSLWCVRLCFYGHRYDMIDVAIKVNKIFMCDWYYRITTGQGSTQAWLKSQMK